MYALASFGVRRSAAALAASAGGLMYALARAGRRAGRWTFAWQGVGLAVLQGV